MYRLSAKEKHNRNISKYLNNGFRFALVSPEGLILKVVQYRYQLEIAQRINKLARVVKISDLLLP